MEVSNEHQDLGRVFEATTIDDYCGGYRATRPSLACVHHMEVENRSLLHVPSSTSSATLASSVVDAGDRTSYREISRRGSRKAKASSGRYFAIVVSLGCVSGERIHPPLGEPASRPGPSRGNSGILLDLTIYRSPARSN